MIVHEMGKFDDQSKYTYKILERLCPILTRANYRKHLPYFGGYLKTTKINPLEQTRTQGTVSASVLEAAEKARQDANREYRKAIQEHGKGIISKNVVKSTEARLDKAEKSHVKLLRRNYRYSLNLHTFILYLFNEARSNKSDIRRIRRVLLNEKIIEVAPFLKYWKDFEDSGFNVCNVLKMISQEFRNQLHLNYDFLSSAIIERYYFEMEDFFSLVSAIPRPDFLASNKQRINTDKLDRLPEIKNKYRKWILPFIEGSIEIKSKVLNGYVLEVILFESSQNKKGQGQVQ